MLSNNEYDTSDEEETSSNAKKRKLTSVNIDLKQIIMGEKLSDLEINFAQHPLKLHFPDLNGLDSTLLQQKKPVFTSEKLQNKLQIIYCFTRDHWIVATNIGCVNNGCISVYDSLFHSIDRTTKRIITSSSLTQINQLER